MHWSKKIPIATFIFLSSTVTYAADSNSDWQKWFVSQVEQQPKLIAAKQRLQSELHMAEANRQPLYNPVLETEIEDKGQDTNYSLGLNQTIDWNDKAGPRKQQALQMELKARANYRLTLSEQLIASLRALVVVSARETQYEFAKQKEQQLASLVELVRARQKAGDLGQIDVELSLASLSQTLNDTAQSIAAYQQAKAEVRELLPSWRATDGEIPSSFWNFEPAFLPVTELLNHPSLMLLKAQWEIQKEASKIANLKKSADPSVGLSFGDNDREKTVSVNFSVPLNIRNNFDAEANAAQKQVLEAEAEFKAALREQQFSVEASVNVSKEYASRNERWATLMSGTGNEGQALLKRQWASGDLATTEYLIGIQQILAGAQAGAELRNQFQLSMLEWLKNSGQIEAIMNNTEL